MDKLYLIQNELDNEWKVLDKFDFTYGAGKTPIEAIDSARIVAEAPIYHNGKKIKKAIEFDDDVICDGDDVRYINRLIKADVDFDVIDDYSVLVYE